MSLKEYIPAIKYGNKAVLDELSFGTVAFTIYAGATSGTFTVTAGACLFAPYVTAKSGGTVTGGYPLPIITVSGATATWTVEVDIGTGSIVYQCNYLKG
jgi:hypothetical protein